MVNKLIISFFFCFVANAQQSGFVLSKLNDNLPEEKEFFLAYKVEVDSAAFLQTILDREGAVRLGLGIFTPAGDITMSSGQRLYGHQKSSTMDVTIIIPDGTDNIHVQDFFADSVRIEGSLRNSTLKTIRGAVISSVGGSIENNEFIDMDKCRAYWDMSASGYARNNRFIKFWGHSTTPQFYFRGNDVTPSYGNSFLFTNLLFSQEDGIDIDNVDDWTMVGVEAETWNQGSASDQALIKITDAGDVRLSTVSGIYVTFPDPTPSFDIEANDLAILNKTLYSTAGNDTIRGNTNRMIIGGKPLEDYSVLTSPSDFELRSYYGDSIVAVNDVSITTALSGVDSTSTYNQVFKPKRRQWPKPLFDRLPDVNGPNWATDRVGQTDSTAHIQALIDVNGIAELGEGKYYIGSSLVINKDDGIVGMGSGKTSIIGLTDDFPLINITEDTSVERKTSVITTLANLTLQGGSTGVYIDHTGDDYFQPSSCQWNNVIFRDQTNGIHLYHIYGIDNIFIDSVSFVDCTNGVYQEPEPTYNTGMGETDDMTYIDKVCFYRNQFINCDVGFNGPARRPSNLVSWIDSRFDGNGLAIDTQGHVSGLVANCEFTGTTGDFVIGHTSVISIYNSTFLGNAVTDIIELSIPTIEGSNFYDDVTLLESVNGRKTVINSYLKGGLGAFDYGTLMNTKIDASPTLSKPIIKYFNSTPTTILDGEVNPYPQYLVR